VSKVELIFLLPPLERVPPRISSWSRLFPSDQRGALTFPSLSFDGTSTRFFFHIDREDLSSAPSSPKSPPRVQCRSSVSFRRAVPTPPFRHRHCRRISPFGLGLFRSPPKVRTLSASPLSATTSGPFSFPDVLSACQLASLPFFGLLIGLPYSAEGRALPPSGQTPDPPHLFRTIPPPAFARQAGPLCPSPFEKAELF